MRLETPSGRPLWLAYGMNVHEGGTAKALERAIETTVLPLRRRLAPDEPFGIALRLHADGVRALLGDEERLADLRARLRDLRLVPFTGNAFVAGDFHAPGTKALVYRPTWAEEAREAYTVAFAEAMVALLGPGAQASLSTMPLSFRGFDDPQDLAERAAGRLASCARRLRSLEETSGTRVVLAIEPEPGCTLESVDDVVRFFRGPLRRALRGEASAARHVGVCYDVCHQAVQGEDPREGLSLLRSEGIAVAKVQASCALEVPDPSDLGQRQALARFSEPRWLHQVVGGAADPRLRAPDLPEALGGADAPRWARAAPWRVHFHVPVHRESLEGGLRTTRASLDAALAVVAPGAAGPHVEIETYTWEGLSERDRSGDSLVDSLEREYRYVLDRLAAAGVRRVAG
jgi:sugar phosphate isomerase/epimerase